MRSTYSRSTGIRRLSSVGDPPSAEETINVGASAGQLTIDITQISGVDISAFYEIDIFFDQVATQGAGTGVGKGVQVSTDGGSTFLATGYLDIIPNTAVNQTMVLQQLAAGTFTSWCRLMNTNQTGIPCHFKNTYSGVSPTMGRVNSTTAVIDALRFIVKSDASSVTWLSGTIRIVGYRKPALKTTTQTDSFDGIKTEIIFNIPSGHTVGYLEVEDVAASAPFGIVARMGNSGVFRATADHLRQRITSPLVGSQHVTDSILFLTDSSVTQDANCEFWNLNTAAPVIVASSMGDTGSEIRNLMMVPDETPFSQIRLFGFTGVAEKTLTAGTVRLTTYEVENTVFSWAPDGSASHDFTGLGGFSGAVLTCPSLMVLSATDTIRATVSGDVGATDYRTHVSTVQAQEVALRISEDTQTNARFSAVFTSLNSASVPTQMSWASNHNSSLIRQAAGVRDAAQKDTSIQVKTTGGALMNSAPLPITLVGYKL